MITIDSREPEEMQTLCKDKWENNIEIKKLETGDYLFNNELIFERKTITDLWSSFTKKRLFNQIGNMIEKYKYPCLIVEGNYIPVRLRKRRLVIMHLLNSISFLCPVIRTDGKKDTVNEMDRLWKKYRDDKLCLVERKTVVEKKKDDIDTFLCSIPNVDNKVCEAIKKYSNSLYDLWSQYDLNEWIINGKKLGKRGDKITEFLHKQWKKQER